MGRACRAASQGKRPGGHDISNPARTGGGNAFVSHLTVIEITKPNAYRQAVKPMRCCLWIFCG